MSVYRTPMVFIFVAFSKPFPVVILCKPSHTLGMNWRETIRAKAQHDVDQFNDANDDILAPPRLDKCVELSQSGDEHVIEILAHDVLEILHRTHDVFSYFAHIANFVAKSSEYVGRHPRRDDRSDGGLIADQFSTQSDELHAHERRRITRDLSEIISFALVPAR